ncbi:unnamed protein product [Caenorhabditis brenneri]
MSHNSYNSPPTSILNHISVAQTGQPTKPPGVRPPHSTTTCHQFQPTGQMLLRPAHLGYTLLRNRYSRLDYCSYGTLLLPCPMLTTSQVTMTANWPAAAVSVPVKARKPTKNDEEDQLPDGISSSINSWVQRQKL